jgi:hypothetical protein
MNEPMNVSGRAAISLTTSSRPRDGGRVVQVAAEGEEHEHGRPGEHRAHQSVSIVRSPRTSRHATMRSRTLRAIRPSFRSRG